MLISDVIVDVKFYDTDNNGRKSATPTDFFACIFSVDETKYDCRLLLKEIGPIRPGDLKKDIPIKFLCPDLVMPKLAEGKNFYLWEMGNIAEGKVVKITNSEFQQA